LLASLSFFDEDERISEEPSGKVLNVGYREQENKIIPAREGVFQSLLALGCGIVVTISLCKGVESVL